MNSLSPEEFFEDAPVPPPPIRPAQDTQETKVIGRLRSTIHAHGGKFNPGDQVGNYVLEVQLGTGAMGTVFKGRHRQSGEYVAIKVLNVSFAAQKSALQRFEKEARMLSGVQSQHITRLIEFNSHGDQPYIVTELVEGTTLERLIRERGQLDESEALDIAIQTAKALADLAEINVLHRDVKPGNILLAEKDNGGTRFEARLTDFGLARSIQQSGSMEITRANSVLGTPFYMSPEQFSDAKHVDCRSDIYSLGATLFHMLAGEPPFPSTEVLELAELHRHTPPPDIRSLNPKVSDATAEMISRCLQKRTDLRYANPEELIADLNRVRLGKPIHIASHPQIPCCDVSQLVVCRLELELDSSAADLWPFVSNTERLNRAMGLPAISYRSDVGAHGQAEVYAHVRIMGIPMKWREHVYEWIEESRMGILREFETGPLKWFTSVVEFLPTASGRTRLIHTLKILPNGWFGRQFARLKMGRTTVKMLTKIYRRMDAVLKTSHGSDPAVDPFEATPSQTKTQQVQQRRVIDRLSQRKLSANVVMQVSDYVATAPAQELGRIRPFVLANRLNLPADQILNILMAGANDGLFELAWDVICPSCRIASQTYSLLKMVRDHEHCDACQVEFQVDFAKSVEAIFRAHPSVRSVDTGKYCIGGPAHSPHVAAQIRLASKETAELGLSLEEGTFRVHSPQLAKSVKFQVQRTGTSVCRSLKIRLDDSEDWSQDVSLNDGQQLITLVNSFDREVLVKVERTNFDQRVLTAADAIALPVFRELFPSEHFSPHQLSTLSNLAIVRTVVFPSETADMALRRADLQQHFQSLHVLCDDLGGTWLKATDNGSVLVFSDPKAAVRLVQRVNVSLPRSAQCSIGAAVCEGAVTASLIGGCVDYYGEPIDRLAMLASHVLQNECLVSQSLVDEFRQMDLDWETLPHLSIPNLMRVEIPKQGPKS